MISNVSNFYVIIQLLSFAIKYGKSIRLTILKFNKIIIDINIDPNTTDSRDCQAYIFFILPCKCTLHVIPDSRSHDIISKGPKF